MLLSLKVFVVDAQKRRNNNCIIGQRKLNAWMCMVWQVFVAHTHTYVRHGHRLSQKKKCHRKKLKIVNRCAIMAYNLFPHCCSNIALISRINNSFHACVFFDLLLLLHFTLLLPLALLQL